MAILEHVEDVDVDCLTDDELDSLYLEAQRHAEIMAYSLGLGIAIGRSGFEISGKNGNWRVAPFGNRTDPPHPTGKYPHYHRRKLDANGRVIRDQGIKRHRPYDKRPTDKTWRDRW